MPRPLALQLLAENGVTGPALLGRRGYYANTMSHGDTMARGIYDDAIVLLTPTAFVTFNANCDPSRFQPGIATLVPGVWRYKIGTHGLSRPKDKQYTALVQAAPVTVRRDPVEPDEAPHAETGWFGINVHCGSHNSTSSEGCQTIYPDQWESFIALVKSEMQRHELLVIPYVLTEREKGQ